jgi:hypothetical protein
MEKKFLIILSGISVKSYGLDTIKANQYIWKDLIANYDGIFEPDYNQFLDTWTIQNEFNLKYFDPLRLTLNPFRKHKIIENIESIIKQKQKEGYRVDCICHSQGCWVLALCDVTVNKILFAGNPIGFEDLIGRAIVRQTICPFPWNSPKLKCFEFINIYSNNDFVGHVPIALDKKWTFKATIVREYNSETNHDLDSYLNYMEQKKII